MSVVNYIVIFFQNNKRKNVLGDVITGISAQSQSYCCNWFHTILFLEQLKIPKDKY